MVIDTEDEKGSDARTRLLELSQENRVSLSRLSSLIGRNTSYLQQFIKKGSPRRLEERDRHALAEFFGVNEGELGALEEKSYAANSSLRDEDFIAVPRLSITVSAGPGRFAGSETPFDNFGFSGRWLRENGFDAKQLSIKHLSLLYPSIFEASGNSTASQDDFINSLTLKLSGVLILLYMCIKSRRLLLTCYYIYMNIGVHSLLLFKFLCVVTFFWFFCSLLHGTHIC